MQPVFKTSSSSSDANKYHDVDTLAIDVSFLAHRHAHALGQRFLTSDGRMSGHLYGAFKNLKSLMGSMRPRQLAFCYDRGYTWRSALVPSYKATRRPLMAGDDAWTPTPELERLFRTFPGLHLSYADLEADDMAAWMAYHHDREGALVIYSADRDLWQLVSDSDDVACVFPKKASPRAKSANFWVRESVVKEDFGVSPKALAKLKALMGDPSDNIKGIQGGSRPGKKEALRSFAESAASAAYFDPKLPDFKLTDVPDFLHQPMQDERGRMVANYQITNLRNAADRVQGNPVEKTTGNLADALGVLVEFECDSLLAQCEPLFKELTR